MEARTLDLDPSSTAFLRTHEQRSGSEVNQQGLQPEFISVDDITDGGLAYSTTVSPPR